MTWSILARDPDASELGLAARTRFFAVGRIVPWIEAGVAAAASQVFANPAYGRECLQLLRAGMDPQAALDSVRTADPGETLRQVAILDSQGRIALHTGARCVPAAAGHAIGTHCRAAANMMARDTVWRAMIHTFETTNGPLADRLLAAMEAAEREAAICEARRPPRLLWSQANRPTPTNWSA